MKSCVFCEISQGRRDSNVIYQTDAVICFLPLTLQAYGHTIIAPKQHFADIYTIPEVILTSLTAVTKTLALHYKEQINATGVNLLHASGISAQQSVFHFHVHLIPRFENDGLNLWPEFPTKTYNMDEMLKKLMIGN